MYPGAQPRCEDTAQPKQGLAEERELFLIAYITQRKKAYIYISFMNSCYLKHVYIIIIIL